MASARVLLPVVVASCGCGDDADRPGGRPDDGGAGSDAGSLADAGDEADAGGEVDGGTGRTVTGSQVNLHVTAAGEVMAAIDLSGAVVEVLVDDGAGGTARFTATSLRVPEGVMVSGEAYFAEIDALSDPDIDIAASPRRKAGPRRSISRRPTATYAVE